MEEDLDELKSLMLNPAYYQDRDEEIIERITFLFRKITGYNSLLKNYKDVLNILTSLYLLLIDSETSVLIKNNLMDAEKILKKEGFL